MLNNIDSDNSNNNLDTSYISYDNKSNNEFIGECNFIELFNNECKLKKTNNTYTQLYIREKLLNGNLDQLINNLLRNESENLIIDNDDIKYEIKTTNNNNNEYKNISIIKLGGCEDKLKKHYNISENNSLVIFKIDIYKEGFLIPLVEYEIFDIENKKQLNSSICKDTRIEILYPCIIDENNLFKYNQSSEYYNDICYPYTTEDDTDIILSDRKNEYIDNNMFLCEKNCEYNGYDSNTKKAKCECDIKINLPLISEIKFNKEKLLNKFINIDEITNLKIIKCYEALFSIEGLKKNIGNYTIFSIIFVNIICFIIFVARERKFLFTLINEIFFKRRNGGKSFNSLNIYNSKIDGNSKKKLLIEKCQKK
jgi:hypothetical protein